MGTLFGSAHFHLMQYTSQGIEVSTDGDYFIIHHGSKNSTPGARDV
jgi:hypothetical protein